MTCKKLVKEKDLPFSWFWGLMVVRAHRFHAPWAKAHQRCPASRAIRFRRRHSGIAKYAPATRATHRWDNNICCTHTHVQTRSVLPLPSITAARSLPAASHHQRPRLQRRYAVLIRLVWRSCQLQRDSLTDCSCRREAQPANGKKRTLRGCQRHLS